MSSQFLIYSDYISLLILFKSFYFTYLSFNNLLNVYSSFLFLVIIGGFNYFVVGTTGRLFNDKDDDEETDLIFREEEEDDFYL